MTMPGITCFDAGQMKIVRGAHERSVRLVSDYYRIAPREWGRMSYQVKTLRTLDPCEVTEKALAQTLCYSIKREVGSTVIEEGDLYMICLQDQRILEVVQEWELRLGALLTYVLTHELVHVVRFGQELQQLDLAFDLRAGEEQRVEKTTRAILAAATPSCLSRKLAASLETLYATPA